ncbi:hypothetical protein TYRP_008544 [Tyrophagus putrescentiae]|nr:hypothetical protein TYRP_008544 [Tyrophagus putrescentiae]
MIRKSTSDHTAHQRTAVDDEVAFPYSAVSPLNAWMHQPLVIELYHSSRQDAAPRQDKRVALVVGHVDAPLEPSPVANESVLIDEAWESDLVFVYVVEVRRAALSGEVHNVHNEPSENAHHVAVVVEHFAATVKQRVCDGGKLEVARVPLGHFHVGLGHQLGEPLTEGVQIVGKFSEKCQHRVVDVLSAADHQHHVAEVRRVAVVVGLQHGVEDEKTGAGPERDRGQSVGGRSTSFVAPGKAEGIAILLLNVDHEESFAW